MSTTAPIQRSVDELAAPARRYSLWFDPLLLLATLGLMAASLVTLRGATQDDVAGQPWYYLERQAIFFGAGLLLAFAISRIDYSRLRELRHVLYGLMIGSILLVFVLGSATRGSKRWLDLIPGFRLQPSELGKLLLIIALSGLIVDRIRRLQDRDTTARAMLVALFPALLVIAQPDLGSGLVYVVISVAVLFVAGISWRHFAALGVLAATAVTVVLVVAPATGMPVLHGYQVDRLTAFMHPSNDPSETGYQQQQSKIAIGSGEKTGRGEQATQTRLNFLPEHHTDFIFAVIGETYGFAGAAFVLSMYALLIWRGLRILTIAKNLFGALIAGGIVAMLLWQVFVNVGMTVGIMPITGVPLPLLSYGGSSVIVTMLALGLLHSIYAQARTAQAAKGRASVL